MKICMITAWDNGAKEIGEFTHKNHQDYCDKHGYKLLGGLSPKPLFHWVKLPFLTQGMLMGYDWCVWVDADAVVTNPEVTLESRIELAGSCDLMVGVDVNGMNNGVMFWKNTPWSQDLIIKWNRLKQLFNCPNPEQEALKHLLKMEDKKHYTLVCQKPFNAYMNGLYGRVYPEGEWEKGDFILHLPSLSHDQRMDIFSQAEIYS